MTTFTAGGCESRLSKSSPVATSSSSSGNRKVGNPDERRWNQGTKHERHCLYGGFTTTTRTRPCSSRSHQSRPCAASALHPLHRAKVPRVPRLQVAKPFLWSRQVQEYSRLRAVRPHEFTDGLPARVGWPDTRLLVPSPSMSRGCVEEAARGATWNYKTGTIRMKPLARPSRTMTKAFVA